MRVALITGGNKGLGYETARQLKEQGYKVYIGSRDTARGAQAAEALDVTSIQLDVTDEDSIKQAAEAIQAEEGRLDILINNAGISGSMKPPEAITAEVMQQVYDTNVFGIVRMMHHFVPLLEQSSQPVVVNVSSGLGSFGMVTNPDTEEYQVNSLAYCSSKSAVTMLTVQYAKRLTHMQINAADPGSTNTDLVGDFSNQAKPATEGVVPIVKLATIDKEGPTGTFINADGPMPW
ncbi:NAD(P)-dependent dehydrogenase (short-subunit alcohol dehydrogenase family) [Staphylococcus auricularis]|uniref:KR domain-containing protein n=1 Tax=Staphylococcus auricularis TaxID=29379 RepID=A0AAP8TSG1_9STAP|nr:SDR family NAD(P)-dependent oxidoreductase [Staphylococcus auricularis]MBM0867168.1 SDR family NAD(P)-dependent oxidoreductase [Staphylococcus auricularis]MCG7340859.1 SDR family NAD(P)-dependent oxidoreductase [Staphylococcus auricularis]PNZ66036.1 KR domain-containing protein [Staphylococcus auricularis]QPT06009.1 SDR family NAD(P)-dependent oxidoreductase [Staphylococcus auricularis]SQJ06586.1 short chain dehydrogenase [Staphylococcus auricularis]